MKANYDIACVNKGETEIFPYDGYRISIKGSDDSAHPCLFIESLLEGFCVQADFDGTICNVIRCGIRDTNNIKRYKDMEAKLREWFPKQSKDANADCKTNLELLRMVWEIIHE